MNATRTIASFGAALAAACVAMSPAVGQAAPSTRPNLQGPPYTEAMTWPEIRAAIDGGKKTIIIPTGGTEQNGPHMTLGKHNLIVTFAAGILADRVNALVAPTVKWVPEGNPLGANFGARQPGVISLPSPSYESLLDAAARSYRAHGFTEILLIGDSGGNQGGLSKTADSLNKEWAGTGVKVYALTDYYAKGHANTNAWLLDKFGYDSRTVGSHAGILDTSQLLWVQESNVRKDKILLNGGGPQSGVNGDPTKATAEIGKTAIEFKVAAGVAQYTLLKGKAP